jgi:hypothetical protein
MEFTAARRNQSINYIWIGLLHNKSKSPSPSGPGSWAMPVNLAFLLLSKSQSLSLILLNQLLGHKSPNPKHKAQGRPEPKVQSPRPTRALTTKPELDSIPRFSGRTQYHYNQSAMQQPIE